MKSSFGGDPQLVAMQASVIRQRDVVAKNTTTKITVNCYHKRATKHIRVKTDFHRADVQRHSLDDFVHKPVRIALWQSIKLLLIILPSLLLESLPLTGRIPTDENNFDRNILNKLKTTPRVKTAGHMAYYLYRSGFELGPRHGNCNTRTEGLFYTEPLGQLLKHTIDLRIKTAAYQNIR